MSTSTETRAPWWVANQVQLPAATSGAVEVRQFTVGEEDALGQMLAAMKGGRSVPAGTYTGLYRSGSLWMSDTPDEQRDAWDFQRAVRARGGRVLINGLGLGMTVGMALDAGAEHVDVVEVDPDVVALVGPTWEATGKVTVHLGDAYDQQWPKGARWTCAWHDIWETLCTDDLALHSRLLRKYGRRVDWQEAWGHDLLVARRRQEQHNPWGSW